MGTTFAAAINCMDGRVQLPVISYMKKYTGADFIDMITEPGPVQYLAHGSGAHFDSIMSRLEISIEVHATTVVALVAHYDCAGNPVDEIAQRQQLRDAYKQMRGHFPESVELNCLWVDADLCVHPVEVHQETFNDTI